MYTGLGSLLEALEQNRTPCLFQLLPFSKPAQWGESFSHQVTLTFSAVVLSPSASLFYFPFLPLRKLVIVVGSPRRCKIIFPC